MQKPTFSYGSTFIRALALTTLAAGATFLSPARAQQASTPSAQQAPASSATQDSSAASTPAKPDAKATPAKKPSTKTAQTKPAATAASQADAPAKASPSASGSAPSTKQASAATAGQAGAAKTGPVATKTTKPGASKTATAKTAAALTLNTPKDKQSYAIGINVGKGLSQNLKQSGVDIDPAILTRAIKDVLSGGKQSMTDQEAQATLTALQADMRKAQEQKQQQASEANKKEGDEFLAANKTKEGVTTLPDGLQYKILQEGTGPKPSATDAVTVNYRGALVNGTEFDSSYKRNQPLTIGVSGQIIKGWTEALQLMPVGSKWQIFIPSDLAYGPSGRPPVIGPNSTLVFEVELVSIQPKPAAPAPAAAPATAPAPAAASPNAPAPNPAPTPNASAPPKPTPPAPKPDQAPAPTPKPPTP
jgi:FKBP-type peptidyl-prolyl cis-trans isomerase